MYIYVYMDVYKVLFFLSNLKIFSMEMKYKMVDRILIKLFKIYFKLKSVEL